MRSAQWFARNGATTPVRQRDEADAAEAQDAECAPLPLAPLTAREYRHARRVWTQAIRASYWLRHVTDPDERERLLWLVALVPALNVALHDYEHHGARQPLRRARRRWRRFQERGNTRPLRCALKRHHR
jgi:hypothetical protein